ncbi:hypothetical protein V6N12_058424 [Hibiscus sabdariffa]|uniref:Uncharacterized protein n=1 Tax=Hibiscus sabdariffa TaxID=183260 RepID=A0ABR2EUQ2_9ROSI
MDRWKVKFLTNDHRFSHARVQNNEKEKDTSFEKRLEGVMSTKKLWLSTKSVLSERRSLVGFGCHNTDKKVVFSAKLLRKRVHLDEGDFEDFFSQTIDVMRVLLAYGFDYVNVFCGE